MSRAVQFCIAANNFNSIQCAQGLRQSRTSLSELAPCFAHFLGVEDHSAVLKSWLQTLTHCFSLSTDQDEILRQSDWRVNLQDHVDVQGFSQSENGSRWSCWQGQMLQVCG
jgi:hypothetical protein